MRQFILTEFFTLLLLVSSCSGQPEQKQSIAAVSGNDVEIYYFHNAIRCVTCLTIEAETRRIIEMLYPSKYKEGKISFTSLSLDEDAGKNLGEKLGISGQTLIIVSGDQKVNITNEGFLYAVGKPEKFKEVLKSKVDPFIKQ